MNNDKKVMRDIEVEDVKRLLHGRWLGALQALAPSLGPAIDKVGRHVECPVHGGKSQDGYRLFKDADRTGGGCCNSCGFFPDGIANLGFVNGWDFETTLYELATYLGLITTAGERAQPVTTPIPVKVEDLAKKARLSQLFRDRLRAAWREAIPLDHKDAEIARLYLARRGLNLWSLDVLRFHPKLPYSDNDGSLVGFFPAIIAMVADAKGVPVTLHRIYLAKDGRKAPVENAKKTMAYPDDRTLTGGAIHLAKPGEILALAEGIETALAVMEATEIPTWATVNAGLMEKIILPEGVKRVLVFADKDRSERGKVAARTLVTRLWEEGRMAGTLMPHLEIPEDKKGVDWLDVLVRCGKTAFPDIDRAVDYISNINKRRSNAA
jgi:phage/plasmid primase-like uncharacterized protein